MASGKSKGEMNPNGERKKAGGQELAPKSLRHKVKYLADCSDKDLEKIGITR